MLRHWQDGGEWDGKYWGRGRWDRWDGLLSALTGGRLWRCCRRSLSLPAAPVRRLLCFTPVHVRPSRLCISYSRQRVHGQNHSKVTIQTSSAIVSALRVLCPCVICSQRFTHNLPKHIPCFAYSLSMHDIFATVYTQPCKTYTVLSYSIITLNIS